jgi:uncharacterized membrane protein
MKRLSRWDALALGVTGLSAAVTLALYSRLPARVPIHFGVDGLADRWASRAEGAFALPVVSLLTWLLLSGGGALLREEARARFDASPRAPVSALLCALFAATQGAVLYASFHPQRSLLVGLLATLGLFFAALGLLLPRLRRNPLLGVRTPWSRGSDEAWRLTHRFAGWALTLGGLACAAFARASPALALAALLVAVVAPLLYSFGVRAR